MTLKSIYLTALLTVAAHANVTIQNTAVDGVKMPDGVTNIPTGSLALVIVDVAGDGFFRFGTNLPPNAALTWANEPWIEPSQANLTIGSIFGGEKILNVLSSPS